MKEKMIVGSPFFWAFPCDRTPKATNDVSVHLFIHSNNSYKFYQRILVIFLSYTYVSIVLRVLTCVGGGLVKVRLLL